MPVCAARPVPNDDEISFPPTPTNTCLQGSAAAGALILVKKTATSPVKVGVSAMFTVAPSDSYYGSQPETTYGIHSKFTSYFQP